MVGVAALRGSSAAGHAAFSVPGADEVVEGGGGFVAGAADVEYRSGDRVAGDFAPHAVRISHDVPGDLGTCTYTCASTPGRPWCLPSKRSASTSARRWSGVRCWCVVLSLWAMPSTLA